MAGASPTCARSFAAQGLAAPSDWWAGMQVEVSARKLDVPPVCACCCEAATDQLPVSSSRTKGKRVVRTETVVWHFPYCAHCLRHLQAVPGPAGGFAALLLLAGLVLLFFAPPAGVVSLFLACVIGVISFIVRRSRLAYANSLRKPSCARVEAAVRLLRWKGTHLVFEMDSPGFVLAFSERNHEKMVNVPPAAAQWIRDSLAQQRSPAGTIVEAQPVPTPSGASSTNKELVAIISKLEGAKGPAARRAILASALPTFAESTQRNHLLLEASRIEVEAVLNKVDGLKTAAARRRNLQAALDEIRSDPVPDELQAQQIHWLEEALAELDKAT